MSKAVVVETKTDISLKYRECRENQGAMVAIGENGYTKFIEDTWKNRRDICELRVWRNRELLVEWIREPA